MDMSPSSKDSDSLLQVNCSRETFTMFKPQFINMCFARGQQIGDLILNGVEMLPPDPPDPNLPFGQEASLRMSRYKNDHYAFLAYERNKSTLTSILVSKLGQVELSQLENVPNSLQHRAQGNLLRIWREVTTICEGHDGMATIDILQKLVMRKGRKGQHAEYHRSFVKYVRYLDSSGTAIENWQKILNAIYITNQEENSDLMEYIKKDIYRKPEWPNYMDAHKEFQLIENSNARMEKRNAEGVFPANVAHYNEGYSEVYLSSIYNALL